VTYLARSRSEEEQTTFIAPFQEALAVKEGEKPVEEDETKKRTVVGNVLDAITAVGEGSPRGM
jgi:translation initiation factor 3 subunit M